jgi:hypothetical protein
MGNGSTTQKKAPVFGAPAAKSPAAKVSAAAPAAAPAGGGFNIAALNHVFGAVKAERKRLVNHVEGSFKCSVQRAEVKERFDKKSGALSSVGVSIFMESDGGDLFAFWGALPFEDNPALYEKQQKSLSYLKGNLETIGLNPALPFSQALPELLSQLNPSASGSAVVWIRAKRSRSGIMDVSFIHPDEMDTPENDESGEAGGDSVPI